MEKRFAGSFFHPTGDKNNALLENKKKKKKRRKKKKSIAFPPKSVKKIDGDLVLERQRADIRKSS